jgi:hypothetical protein
MFVIGILYSYSRAAYLGLFMQLLYVLVLRKQFNWIKSLGLAMMVALCIFCIMFDSRISHRTAEIAAFDDSAIANRLQVFSTAVDLFFEEPFAGPGAGVFGTLYNRCYKRPDFRHPMTGAHSTIVSLLLIVGACGIFFIVVLVTAGQPRRFWLSQELFVRLALIGIMPYMATEYCGYAPIVTVVLFWLLVCMLYSSASIGFVESKRSVIVMWLVAFLWLGGLLHTLPSPESRYSSGVDRILYRLGGDVSYYVKDFNTGMEWSKRDRRLYPGGFLPSIVIALTSDVYKTTGDCVIPPKLNGSGIIDHLPDRPYDMACKNCEFLMLQCADVSAANSLINSIGAAKLQNYAYSLDMPFLIPRFYNPISLQNGSTNVKYHEFGAQISSRAASQLICKLVDEMEDSTAKEALRIHSRGWGMTRHLRPIISCYNMLDSGPSRLAEVTYVVGYKERWVACILGKNVINSRGVIDDRGSRALAEIGWRTHLLLVNR